MEGFEPSTPCARGTCAAKLRHTLIKLLPEGIEPIIIRLKAGHPDLWTTGAKSTHGWIRTTINAVNSRALYRLSYMGKIFKDLSSLSRVDSNHDRRIQSPPLCQLSYGSTRSTLAISFGRATFATT